MLTNLQHLGDQPVNLPDTDQTQFCLPAFFHENCPVVALPEQSGWWQSEHTEGHVLVVRKVIGA